MDRAHRHDLKHDRFVEQVGHTVEYAAEHKQPLELGEIDSRVEQVLGRFWCTEIARHDRRRLAYAVWSVLSGRLLHAGGSLRMPEVPAVP